MGDQILAFFGDLICVSHKKGESAGLADQVHVGGDALNMGGV